MKKVSILLCFVLITLAKVSFGQNPPPKKGTLYGNAAGTAFCCCAGNQTCESSSCGAKTCGGSASN
jgi:hypothetical protein